MSINIRFMGTDGEGRTGYRTHGIVRDLSDGERYASTWKERCGVGYMAGRNGTGFMMSAKRASFMDGIWPT